MVCVSVHSASFQSSCVHGFLLCDFWFDDSFYIALSIFSFCCLSLKTCLLLSACPYLCVVNLGPSFSNWYLMIDTIYKSIQTFIQTPYTTTFSYSHTTTVRSCERNRTKCHQLMKATPRGLKLLSCQTGDWTFTSYSAKPQMCASKTTQGLKIFLCVCRSVKEELARWDHSGSPWGGRGDVRSAAGVPRGHGDQQHPHGSGHHQRVRGSSGRER